MSIDIYLHESRTSSGQMAAVCAEARILHSPREGFDNEKLGALERDLSVFLTDRINAAIKRGGAE